MIDPPRKLWTRAEYEGLSSLGVLECQRLELIEGKLIDKTGKHRAHVNSLTLLQAWLAEVYGARFVNPGAPIDVAPEDNPSNEPEPDLIVLTRDLSHFTNENPQPQDLRLVVEVADSTLRFDLTTKAALYARAGIVEYWVMDIAGQRMIVHRDPQFGRYAYVLAYGVEERVAPLAIPESYFQIKDAFPG